jgi:hypothetical protein
MLLIRTWTVTKRRSNLLGISSEANNLGRGNWAEICHRRAQRNGLLMQYTGGPEGSNLGATEHVFHHSPYLPGMPHLDKILCFCTCLICPSSLHTSCTPGG